MTHTVSLVGITKPIGKFESMSLEEFIVATARVSNPSNETNTLTSEKLIKYCIKNKHWSIFETASITVYIETSRAIAQQILRHRSFSFQEFSQRYSDVNEIGNNILVPIELRKKSVNGNRQSSSDVLDDTTSDYYKEIEAITNASTELYKRMVNDNIAPETARFILPLTTKTRMYMTGSVRSWIHYMEVRLSEHTQKEHRLIAESIFEELKSVIPIITNCLA